MAYTTNPYATAEQVYNALNLSPQSQAGDAAWIASDLLPQAQATIDEFVGYPFQSDGPGSIRYLSGNENPTILVPDFVSALTQVLEISQDSYLNYGGDGTTQISFQTLDITTDCIVGPDNDSPGFTLRRYSQLPFFFGNQNYKLTGTFGHTSIPADITRAAIRLVIHWYKMRDFNYTGMTGNQQYGGQTFSMCDIPEDVNLILRRHRIPQFLAWSR